MTADYDLRFAVVTGADGAVEVRYLRNPKDGEGVTIRLTAREVEELAHALASPGLHAVLRDDGAGERRGESLVPMT
jgi:hypothetical protein